MHSTGYSLINFLVLPHDPNCHQIQATWASCATSGSVSESYLLHTALPPHPCMHPPTPLPACLSKASLPHLTLPLPAQPIPSQSPFWWASTPSLITSPPYHPCTHPFEANPPALPTTQAAGWLMFAPIPFENKHTFSSCSRIPSKIHSIQWKKASIFFS